MAVTLLCCFFMKFEVGKSVVKLSYIELKGVIQGLHDVKKKLANLFKVLVRLDLCHKSLITPFFHSL